jgi:hypothetical protein
MTHIDRDSVLAIAASLFVLFTAMLNPVLTIGLVIVVLIVVAIRRLLGRPHPKG